MWQPLRKVSVVEEDENPSLFYVVFDPNSLLIFKKDSTRLKGAAC
jgi:hypothetical protein